MKKYFLLFTLLTAYYSSTAQQRIFNVNADEVTVVPANNAAVTNGLTTKPFETAPDPKVFAVQSWRNTNQHFTWNLDVKKKGLYQVVILCNVAGLSDTGTVTLQLKAGKEISKLRLHNTGWDRINFPTPILLDAGTNQLLLQMQNIAPAEKPDISVYSVELATPVVVKKNIQLADSLRSKPTWLTGAGYGLFFHWNSRSMPISGSPLPYAEAVKQFDVKKFAQTIHETGADFIILTTGWAEFYFPGPLKSVDKILPGRTTERDLVSDLSDALAQWNIKLLLYYHFRSDEKTTWWKAQQFSPEKPEHLFDNLISIFTEIGQRYHNKIAGMWIDDAMALYPYNAPFKKITGALKGVNKNLVIGYNPWIYPRFTDFQDFYTGESGLTAASAGVNNPSIPVGGNGYYISGPQAGLKATFCGQLEPGDWTHIEANKPIPPPAITEDELIKVVREAKRRKNIPVMNVSVYQDGTISPETFQILKDIEKRYKKE